MPSLFPGFCRLRQRAQGQRCFVPPVFGRVSLGLALLGLCTALAGPAGANPIQDGRFDAARDAFRAGDRARLEKLLPEVRGHELDAYVESWIWKLRLDRLDDPDSAGLRDFLTRHNGEYVAERLRGDWLRVLAKKGRWGEVESEYALLLQPEQEQTCLQLQARLNRGDLTALDTAQPLWLGLAEAPDGCVPVLDALVRLQRVSATDVWERMRRQVEAGKLNGARASAQYLPESQTPEERSLDQALDKPMAWIARLPPGGLSRAQQGVAALAFARMARSDVDAAADALERLLPRLTPSEVSYAWGQIAWQAAIKLHPLAGEWFRRAEGGSMNDEQYAWRVRTALRSADWPRVRAAIETMPPALAAQPEWVYWLGRSLKAAGQGENAQSLFARIAGQASFYGTLAAEEMGGTALVPPRASPPTTIEIERVAGNTGIRRALAFFRMNQRFEAVREWNWALRTMGDRDLLAAAELARQQSLPDRAINTADKTRQEHDYSLRYLAPYSEQVRPVTAQQGLDSAWVYGLMRQESRFITNAKSNVGASGLMQLMPATARWVAKKIGLKDYHPGQVNDTEVNLMLGTSYLRIVMDRLDNHPVLASAAYNAGPGRAQKWRGVKPMEGAIYAETIPFNETRDYVKKVMSNAVFYGAVFNGTPPSLKRLLGTVPAKGADNTADLP